MGDYDAPAEHEEPEYAAAEDAFAVGVEDDEEEDAPENRDGYLDVNAEDAFDDDDDDDEEYAIDPNGYLDVEGEDDMPDFEEGVAEPGQQYFDPQPTPAANTVVNTLGNDMSSDEESDDDAPVSGFGAAP